MRILNCGICGSEFTAYRTEKYCSKHCSHEAAMSRQRSARLEFIKSLGRKCHFCGEALTHPQRKWCSSVCKQAGFRANNPCKWKEYTSRYIGKNREKYLENERNFYKRHRNMLLQANKEYLEANPEVSVRCALRQKHKCEPDEELVQLATMRRIINRAIRKAGG